MAKILIQFVYLPRWFFQDSFFIRDRICLRYSLYFFFFFFFHSVNHTSLLFLCKIFTQIECNCNDDYKTLRNIGICRIHTQKLETDLQDFKYQYADQNTADTTNTTVCRYAADGTCSNCLQRLAHP